MLSCTPLTPLSRHRAAFALLSFLMMLSAACTPGSGDAGAARTVPAVPVKAAAAVQRDVPRQLRAIGTVEAYSTVTLRSQVEGALSQVHFHEGDAVQTGQLLFSIDDRPFAAELRQAQAALARNQAQARNAAVDAKRRAELFAAGLVSGDEYDNSQTNAAALDAAVRADQAAVEQARLRLQYTTIHAPVDGRIGQLLVNGGNLVKANDTALAVLHQIKPVYVSFAVPEQNLATVRQRFQAGALAVDTFTADRPGHVVRGQLSFIDNNVDRTTGTVRLKAVFANDDEALWPGQFVDVALTLEVEAQVVVVPFAAVQTGQQGPYVYVVNSGGEAELRTVEVGEISGTEVILRSGVAAGEVVVTDGQLRLVPGTKVDLSTEPPAGHANADGG